MQQLCTVCLPCAKLHHTCLPVPHESDYSHWILQARECSAAASSSSGTPPAKGFAHINS